jgi:hypothetical protein
LIVFEQFEFGNGLNHLTPTAHHCGLGPLSVTWPPLSHAIECCPPHPRATGCYRPFPATAVAPGPASPSYRVATFHHPPPSSAPHHTRLEGCCPITTVPFSPPYFFFFVGHSSTTPPSPPSSSCPRQAIGPPPPSPSSCRCAAGFSLHGKSHCESPLMSPRGGGG